MFVCSNNVNLFFFDITMFLRELKLYAKLFSNITRYAIQERE